MLILGLYAEDGAVLFYAAVDSFISDSQGQMVWICLEFGARHSDVLTFSEQESKLLELMGHAIKDSMEKSCVVPTNSSRSTDSSRSIEISVPAGSRLFRQDTVPETDRFHDDGWLLYSLNNCQYQLDSNNIVRWKTDNFRALHLTGNL